MSVENAPRGLIGVLAPETNTTVAPEFAILMPPGVTFVTAELVSAKTDPEERLIDYFDQLDRSILQFAAAPIKAVAIASTGASYLVGVARERVTLKSLSARLGIPAISAASAVVDALRCLNAEEIGLVSPYPANLTDASVGYWEAQGFTVAEVASAETSGNDSDSLYSLGTEQARHALAQIERRDLDAVVMLGTDMPSLLPIRDQPRLGTAPVLSCMLCLAWRSVVALEKQTPGEENLLEWVSSAEWGPRLSALLP